VSITRNHVRFWLAGQAAIVFGAALMAQPLRTLAKEPAPVRAMALDGAEKATISVLLERP
jgi:hypothetical protein